MATVDSYSWGMFPKGLHTKTIPCKHCRGRLSISRFGINPDRLGVSTLRVLGWQCMYCHCLFALDGGLRKRHPDCDPEFPGSLDAVKRRKIQAEIDAERNEL